jgi:hypothetical protein
MLVINKCSDMRTNINVNGCDFRLVTEKLILCIHNEHFITENYRDLPCSMNERDVEKQKTTSNVFEVEARSVLIRGDNKIRRE